MSRVVEIIGSLIPILIKLLKLMTIILLTFTWVFFVIGLFLHPSLSYIIKLFIFNFVVFVVGNDSNIIPIKRK